MALRRTLEMLKAGERINDLLYRSTVTGTRRRLARRWASGQAGAGRGAGPGQGRLVMRAVRATQMPR